VAGNIRLQAVNAALLGTATAPLVVPPEPLPMQLTRKLSRRRKQLVAAGLLDTVGDLVATDTQKGILLRDQVSLPTPGALVKVVLMTAMSARTRWTRNQTGS